MRRPDRVSILATLACVAVNTAAPRIVAAQPHARHTPPVTVTPGVGIGPVRLGMTRAQVAAAAGVALRDHPSGQFGHNVQVAGPYYLVFANDDRLTHVEAPVPSLGGVIVAGQTLGPAVLLADIPSRIPGCSAVEVRLGGNVVTCHVPGEPAGSATHFKQGSVQSAVVEVDVERAP